MISKVIERIQSASRQSAIYRELYLREEGKATLNLKGDA